MGRPRKFDTGLPPGVYFKHGAFYKVIRNSWHRLGATPDESKLVLSLLPKRLSSHKQEILQFTYKVLARAKQNAKGRGGGIPFTLTRECVHRMLNEAGWRCAVTGAAFSLAQVKNTRPLAPSIDRIDSGGGYTAGNCRIVCVATNYAMNVWGEAVLWQLFAKRSRTELDSVRQTRQDAT